MIDLANTFFTVPIDPAQWDQFAFTWQGKQYTFATLAQGYFHSPTICHSIVAEHLDELKFSNIQVTHYIDDIMLQGIEESAVEQALQMLLSHTRKEGWEINLARIQGPAQSVKFLGIFWNRGLREILPKVKQKILDFVIPSNKNEAQKFIGLFGYWRAHIPHLGLILCPLYKVIRKKI